MSNEWGVGKAEGEMEEGCAGSTPSWEWDKFLQLPGPKSISKTGKRTCK